LFPLALAALAGAVLGSYLRPTAGTSSTMGLVVFGAAFLAACIRLKRVPPLGVWCAVTVLAFAWRAAAEGSHRPGTPSHLQTTARWTGRWLKDRAGTDGTRGRTTAAGVRDALFIVEGGTLVDGELIAVRSSGAPLLPARGPVAAGRAPGRGRAEVQVHPLLPDEVVRLAPPRRAPLGRWTTWLERRRRDLAMCLSKLERGTTAGLCTALVLGDPRRLPAWVAQLFARTGTMHLLAVSGLHVALVAWVLFGPFGALCARLFRALPPSGSRRARAAFSPIVADLVRVALLVSYVPLVGARPPVVRAAFAFASILLARHVPVRKGQRGTASGSKQRRRPDALTIWSFALLVECVLDPDAPSSVSVGLSYGATLGLILGFAPLRARLSGWLPSGGRIDTVSRLGRPRAAAWRVPLQRAIDLFVAGVTASIAAVLGGLPVAWATFGELGLGGVLATPLLLPLLTLFLIAGWGYALVPGIVPEALLDALADSMLALLELVDRLPGTPAILPPRPFVCVLLVILLVFGALRGVRLCGLFARGLAGVLLLPWSAAPAAFEVHALDVGNGTAVVLRAPGTGVWVFDAGSRDRFGVAGKALAPLLASWEAGPISVVLSHSHRDHRSGLPWLVERYPVRLWAGALPAHLAERLPHTTTVIDGGPGRVDLPAGGLGGRPQVEPPARFELWRGAGESDLSGNETSRTLVVTVDGTRVVLSGDAEGHGLREILLQGALDAPCRLLLAPHHGSDTPLLGLLLERSQPREVWISSTREPGRGPGIGAELDRRGVLWRWTGRDGALSLRLPGTRFMTASGATGTDRADRPP
jgi:competence protein ComEC